MQPMRCQSSELTTRLMTFRNGGRTEDQWLVHPQHIDSYVNYLGRVVATQLALPVLIVSSAVESVAYSLLFIGGVCFRYSGVQISKLSLKRIEAKASSARFTVMWNLGNFFLFNLFCKNVFTNESLARYSVDENKKIVWYRGIAFRLLLCSGIIFVGLLNAELLIALAWKAELLVCLYLRSACCLAALQASRECDKLEVARWLRENPQARQPLTGLSLAPIGNDRIRRIAGAAFFVVNAQGAAQIPAQNEVVDFRNIRFILRREDALRRLEGAEIDFERAHFVWYPQWNGLHTLREAQEADFRGVDFLVEDEVNFFYERNRPAIDFLDFDRVRSQTRFSVSREGSPPFNVEAGSVLDNGSVERRIGLLARRIPRAALLINMLDPAAPAA